MTVIRDTDHPEQMEKVMARKGGLEETMGVTAEILASLVDPIEEIAPALLPTTMHHFLTTSSLARYHPLMLNPSALPDKPQNIMAIMENPFPSNPGCALINQALSPVPNSRI